VLIRAKPTKPRRWNRNWRNPGKSSKDGKEITFKLRQGLHFSDGTHRFRRKMWPITVESPDGPGASFLYWGLVFDLVIAQSPRRFWRQPRSRVNFFGANCRTRRAPSIRWQSCRRTPPTRTQRCWGPFMVSDYKPGSSHPSEAQIRIIGKKTRKVGHCRISTQSVWTFNPTETWKSCASGAVNWISSTPSTRNITIGWRPVRRRLFMTPELPLDTEFMWFKPGPELAPPCLQGAHGSGRRIFGRAISEAINRDDLSRVVFNGHAQPGVGPCFAGQQILVQQTG